MKGAFKGGLWLTYDTKRRNTFVHAFAAGHECRCHLQNILRPASELTPRCKVVSIVGAKNITSHETLAGNYFGGSSPYHERLLGFLIKASQTRYFYVWCTLKIHQSLSLTSFWCRWILTRHPFIKITWEKPTISNHSWILWFKPQNKIINTLSTQVLWYITSCSWCAFQYPHCAINLTIYIYVYSWYIYI